ncbi:WYL domain-containing protein [Glaciecola sp. 2405UD65-10]|uniref:WYL domain-containing protein n=1 Tax=Glaciecola sp. 2405UD65-10 TaxID=3397244 RepID=UPI003B58BE85
MEIGHQVSQSQRERLAYIDFVLYFLGKFNRSALEERFGIKPAAATRDIASYKSYVSHNLIYESGSKHYVISNTFTPLFSHRPDRVLAQISKGFGGINSGKEGEYIPCELPFIMKQPDTAIIAPISRAIFLQKPCLIEYISTSSGHSLREVIPFALVNNGLRWHMRAFDRKQSRFADFVLGRILTSKVIDSTPFAEETRSNDIQWNRIVELELVPHPNQKHKISIAHDYEMVNEVLTLRVRAAVVGYLLRRLNVDCTENHSLVSPSYQLWLRNKATLYGVDNIHLAPGIEEAR